LVAASRGETPVRRLAGLEASLGGRARNVAFAMNAGMFDEDGRPIGLAIVDGKEVHAISRRGGGGNFGLLPNGIFLVRDDGRAEVVPTSRYKSPNGIAFATQSGPMLVIDGKLHPKFERDGDSHFIRNGVGVTAGGKALFVISQDPVSFGKFARLFRDRLKTPDALYFDGSVSSLWDPANGRQDTHSPLGPMVVVLKRPESAPGREALATP
jgi:uncharacterized protein YigE (DUF2233 family)